MKTKYTAANGNVYYIETYEVGSRFGTSAKVRRGGWSRFIGQTFARGADDLAVDAAKRLADAHAAG